MSVKAISGIIFTIGLLTFLCAFLFLLIDFLYYMWDYYITTLQPIMFMVWILLGIGVALCLIGDKLNS